MARLRDKPAWSRVCFHAGSGAAGEDAVAMTGSSLLDAAGRRRSPATMPGFHCGRPPRNKGLQYPADPPTVEEIVAVMRCAGNQPYGLRSRALMVLLWRAGLRISEALSLAESDLDPVRGSVLVRHGKGGKRREVGMYQWAWQHLNAWLEIRIGLRVGALLCVIDGPAQGRPWSPTAARATLRELAVTAGIRWRFAPHQLRHAHAVEMAREGVPLNVMRQLDHANLGITRVYLQGIDSSNHRYGPSRPAPIAAGQRRTPLMEVVQSSSTASRSVSRRRHELRPLLRRAPRGAGRRCVIWRVVCKPGG